jgi:hypothetical protein
MMHFDELNPRIGGFDVPLQIASAHSASESDEDIGIQSDVRGGENLIEIGRKLPLFRIRSFTMNRRPGRAVAADRQLKFPHRAARAFRPKLQAAIRGAGQRAPIFQGSWAGVGFSVFDCLVF